MPGTDTFVGAINGETLTATPQPVPGGLSSLIDCNEITGRGFLERIRRGTCKAVFENPWSSKAAYETTELARPASEIGLSFYNEFGEHGPALTLPVKIHLESPLLGRDCYVGSSAGPIVFEMTSGTTNPPPPNKPISGKLGHLGEEPGEISVVTGHTLVDNSFSAPAATGCGGPFSSIVDTLIDNHVGLPSPAGYNTVIHEGPAKLVTAENVIASEQEVPETNEKESHPGEKRHEKWGQGPGPNHWWH